MSELKVRSVLLRRYEGKILVWCDCDCGAPCPQGKIGSQTRCQVWVDEKHITPECIEYQKRQNRFDR